MRAGIYVRISDDTLGTGLGVARQEADCRALADRLGWEIAGVYSDNDTSAFGGKKRPAYERMLADAAAGRIGAIVVWDTDRLTRQPRELEVVIDLADRLGLALASVGGEIDLATPQGRLTARIKGAVARHEVEQAARRIKRKTQERAENGLPHGRPTYGWHRVSGQDVIDEAQAAVVREISRRIAEGESLRSIAADLNDRGVPSPRDRDWSPASVRQLAIRPRNVADRVHLGQVIGKGRWQPIVDRDLYDRVCAVLSTPGRRFAPDSRHKHLLSGIALCGMCGTSLRMQVGDRHKHPRAYHCPGCYKIRRKAEWVDDYVSEVVCARLALPDAAVHLAEPDDTAEVETLREHAAALRARLQLVADSFAEMNMDPEQVARINARLRPDLERTENRLRQLTAHPALGDLARPDIADVWPGLPLGRRRAAIAALVTIRVLPVGKQSNNRFDSSRVEIIWR